MTFKRTIGIRPQFRMQRTRWGIDARFKFAVDGRSTDALPMVFPDVQLHLTWAATLM